MDERKACVGDMKISIAVIITAVGLTLTTAAIAQSQQGKIAIVDLNRVLNEYYKTPIAWAKFKETADSFKKELEEILAEYREQREELSKLREEQDKPEYTADVREQKKKAYAEKLAEASKRQRDIEEYGRSHQEILEKQHERMRQNIIKEINEAIIKQAREAGYLLVLDKSGNTPNGVPIIVFSQDTLDITSDIIAYLNKNQPKTAEAPKAEEKKKEKK